jgi:hypothetical protein
MIQITKDHIIVFLAGVNFSLILCLTTMSGIVTENEMRIKTLEKVNSLYEAKIWKLKPSYNSCIITK